MTLAIGQSGFAPSPHRWRVEDFFRASEAGVFESQKVELIDGELIDMPPAKDPHAWTVSRLVREVMRIFPDPPYWVKIQTTQRLNDFSAPEPDVAVLSGPPCPPAPVAPRVLLVIEVSDSTLSYDTGEKASLYAANGIADYWVVDVVGRTVEVFRNPVPDHSHIHGWAYRDRSTVPVSGRITPLAKDDAVVEISAFLHDRI